ncbi:hypothetical protein [Paenibacillus silvestris]|jgi:predicted DNA-binding transcriptional regulator AlpA|uniref:hypothetical protein n=1 Tax=Paenibacillus silvestris TaxID=2606219 RepID=UPI00192831EE|nr:hypothetical protein [Paenibacillus silvestris]
MDKRKVITAYRRGMISIQECAQILGVDSSQIMGLMNDPQLAELPRVVQKQPMHG